MSFGKIIDKKNDDLSKLIDKQKVPEHIAIIMDGLQKKAYHDHLVITKG